MQEERNCLRCGNPKSAHINRLNDLICPVLAEGQVSASFIGPKFVSVSLTPEARDALKAYATKERLSLSDAVLGLVVEEEVAESNTITVRIVPKIDPVSLNLEMQEAVKRIQQWKGLGH